VRTLAAATILLALATGTAGAARNPTLREREAVTAALPGYLRQAPVGCVWLRLAVSNNGRWAKVTPVFLDPKTQQCARYVANSYYILRKTRTGWKVVFVGAGSPPCSLGVPVDLSQCRRP
jgi:hypothetical protein